MPKNKTKPRPRPAVRRNKHPPLRNKPVLVRSVSGLSYPIRGALGRQLAEERS
jgi:hypothetical protein